MLITIYAVFYCRIENRGLQLVLYSSRCCDSWEELSCGWGCSIMVISAESLTGPSCSNWFNEVDVSPFGFTDAQNVSMYTNIEYLAQSTRAVLICISQNDPRSNFPVSFTHLRVREGPRRSAWRTFSHRRVCVRESFAELPICCVTGTNCAWAEKQTDAKFEERLCEEVRHYPHLDNSKNTKITEDNVAFLLLIIVHMLRICLTVIYCTCEEPVLQVEYYTNNHTSLVSAAVSECRYAV